MDMKVLVLLLVILVHAYESLDVKVRSLDTNAGIVFIPKGSVILSSNTWTIAIDYPFSLIKENLDQIQKNIQIWKESGALTLGNESTNYLNQLNEEVRKVYRSLVSAPMNSMDIDVNENATLISSNLEPDERNIHDRFKRGLINFAGYLSKILFGTATTKDIERLKSKIKTLSNQGEILKHASNEQITYLKKVKQYMDIEDKRILNTVTAIQSLQQVVRQLVSGQQVIQGTSAIKHASAISLYTQLISSINYIHLRINEIQEIRHQLERGYLDPMIIQPSILKKILVNIKEILPPHIKFAIEPDSESISKYYHWQIVTHFQDEDSLHCIIHVPLMMPKESFLVYNVVPFAVPYTTGTPKRRIKLATTTQYVGITPDKTQFAVLHNDVMSHCIPGPIQVCPTLQTVYTQADQHCLFQLLTSRSDPERIRKCHYGRYYDNDPEIIPLTYRQWAISLTESVSVHIACLELDQASQRKRLTGKPDQVLTRSCILEVPPECQVEIAGRMIPLRLEYTGKNALDTAEIQVILPKLDARSMQEIQNMTYPWKNLAETYQLLNGTDEKVIQVMKSLEKHTMEDFKGRNIFFPREETKRSEWNWQDVLEVTFIVMSGTMAITIVGYMSYRKWRTAKVLITPPPSENMFVTYPNVGETRELANLNWAPRPRYREYLI